MTEMDQFEWRPEGQDRRRILRYVCSGAAQISCLPMVGVRLRGRLRDLGLGGCGIDGIETAYPLDLGVQTELLVEVNSWAFRALGHVRALRNRSGISVEFARLSAGGYNMLADVIAELERPRVVVPRMRIEPASSRGLLISGLMLDTDGVILDKAEAPDQGGLVPLRGTYPLASPVDIYI